MSQADEAPDGAGQTQTTPTREDLIPRAEAEKAFEQRDRYKRELRELKAQLAERSEPKAPKVEQTSGGDEPPAWARALMEQTNALASKLEGKEKGERRAKVVESILAKVPDGNRQLAGVVLDGLIARGSVSLEGENIGAIADAAAKALQTSHGELFRLQGSSASAIQVGPDGSIDWSTVRTAAEVPAEAWQSAPDDVIERLMGGSGSRKTGGLLLGGG